jgi:hypothetical protein
MRRWLQNEWHWEKLFHIFIDAVGLGQGLMLMDTKQRYRRARTQLRLVSLFLHMNMK